MEGYTCGDALLSDMEHPVVVADAGVIARFATYRHLFAPGAQLTVEINVFEQWFTDDLLMADWELAEEWQPLIRTPLVFHRATDGDVFVAFAPVVGETLPYALRAFCDHKETQVAASSYHQPGFISPLVCILNEEVGGEAGPHQCAGRHFPVSFSVVADGEVKTGGLRHDA